MPTFRAIWHLSARSAWQPATFAHRHPSLRELEDDISVHDEAAAHEPGSGAAAVRRGRPAACAAGRAMRLHPLHDRLTGCAG
ncbi:hypothetical protein HBB16_18925 [Pseudonocardia sp. MCCB 268]|nr:hypothetical protein [Pseudonocardia cytotoxica]